MVSIMSVVDFLALLLGVIGIAGSVIPGIPGPPLSWVGLLLVWLGRNDGGHPVANAALLVWLGLTVLVSVLDYVVPAQFTRITGGTKSASRGAIIGLVIGLLVPPVGIIVGSLLGAFVAEFVSEGRDVWSSAKAALGAFAGFMFGTGLKLLVSGLMFYYIIVGIF